MTRLAFACVAALCCLAASLRAAEPEKPQAAKLDPARVVGSVYGKPITAADVGLTEPIDVSVKFDSRDQARWDLMGRITTKFGAPIVDKFVADRKAAPTAEELAEFHEGMKRMSAKTLARDKARLAELRKQLADPKLAAADKTRLKEELELLDKVVPIQEKNVAGERNDVVGKMFVGAWKTERELHRAYGGKIIFQQAGLEALDARRKLFEAAEKSGDLKFDDPGVRHIFYYYANMRHNAVVADPKALEKPWWTREEPKP